MNRRTNILNLLAIVILTAFVTGCATFGLGTDDPLSMFIKMTPKQKLTTAMDLYIKVYDDTEKVLTAPESTAAQKKVAVEKAKILIKYQRTIQLYKMFVDVGTTPDVDDEEALIKFVDELLKAGVNL